MAIECRQWQGYPEWFNPNRGQYEPIHPKRTPLNHIVRNSSNGWHCRKNAEHQVDDNYKGKTCPWCDSPLIKMKVS